MPKILTLTSGFANIHHFRKQKQIFDIK